ncbi:unnamed protein product [Malus baccata var. baccata]
MIENSRLERKRIESVMTCLASLASALIKIRHANIAELVGYCSEHGHNMLIYEYFRNGSLHEFLHIQNRFRHWLLIKYLHDGCFPSTVHKNIKSSNIFLDIELNPRLCNYGLATFHQRTSQNLGMGYSAPECTNSKPPAEQCLVRWATPQLHDLDALSQMVDPALRGLNPPKSISRCADIVCPLCSINYYVLVTTHPKTHSHRGGDLYSDLVALNPLREPEFWPPLSEEVQQLVRLVQSSTANMSEDFALGASRHSSAMSSRREDLALYMFLFISY